MDRLLPFLRIKSGRQVLIATALITTLSVAAPVGTLGVILFPLYKFNAGAYLGALTIGAIIPLLIAPPISLFALSILRLLTLTIERVDEYVRFDGLTGVLSRAFLLGKVRELLPRGGCFLIVDADHFKAINDTYGHDVGDEALKRLAKVLSQTCPVDALVGRLGGEEFGIFLPGARDSEAATAAETLCVAMRESGRVVGEHTLNMTISIGGAEHQKTQSLEKTMKLADSALYHAKRSGRDRFFIAAATDTMPALILKSRRLSNS